MAETKKSKEVSKSKDKIVDTKNNADSSDSPNDENAESMESSLSIESALKKLREDKKRKFVQTIDLIINLKKFDVRSESINTFVQIPNASNKKICAFLEKKSADVETVTQPDFDKYKDQKEIKRLAKKYDFFIATAPLMPQIATKFGRILGPIGKMPSPQAGIMPNENLETIKAMVEKMGKLVRIRTKEKSLKIPIGKEDMSDKELKENILAVLNSVKNALPQKKENIKNILIKFTMTSSIKLDVEL